MNKQCAHSGSPIRGSVETENFRPDLPAGRQTGKSDSLVQCFSSSARGHASPCRARTDSHGSRAAFKKRSPALWASRRGPSVRGPSLCPSRFRASRVFRKRQNLVLLRGLLRLRSVFDSRLRGVLRCIGIGANFQQAQFVHQLHELHVGLVMFQVHGDQRELAQIDQAGGPVQADPIAFSNHIAFLRLERLMSYVCFCSYVVVWGRT